ncbi:hypothetical protein BU17DRAFT_61792 [Hysterangium stoloniferum]|nr:hypothetical protein BU17DRAFT_61792 [Hysterangium stoloniferum]
MPMPFTYLPPRRAWGYRGTNLPPSLTLIMDMDTTYSLSYGISDLETFFGNSALHTHHIKQLIVVHSLIGPLLRLILTHPSPNVYLLSSGGKLIEITLNLIAASSDIESASSTVRNLDIIAIFPRLLPHCEAIRGSLDDQYLGFLEELPLTAQSLLCVIATPFTDQCWRTMDGLPILLHHPFRPIFHNFCWITLTHYPNQVEG